LTVEEREKKVADMKRAVKLGENIKDLLGNPADGFIKDGERMYKKALKGNKDALAFLRLSKFCMNLNQMVAQQDAIINKLMKHLETKGIIQSQKMTKGGIILPKPGDKKLH
jgi:hypothetical protein